MHTFYELHCYVSNKRRLCFVFDCYVSDKHTIFVLYSDVSDERRLCFVLDRSVSDKSTIYLYFIVTLLISARSVLYLIVT